MARPFKRTGALRALERVALTLLPVAAVAGMVGFAVHDGDLAVDARVGYLPFARDIVHGISPYPTANLPPVGIAMFVPFTAVPRPEYLLTALAIALVPAILLALDVRDWRCYGVVLLWVPTLSAIQTVNLTIPLVLAAALAWRWRDRRWPAAVAVGLSIAAKLISAPLLAWQVGTRRMGAAALSVAIAVGVTLTLLGLISLLGGNADSFVGKAGSVPGRSDTPSYSPMDFTAAHGLGRISGAAIGGLVVVALCALAVALGRRGDDRRSFAVAAAAIVVFAPNVWLHSLLFLVLPLGVLRPRLDWLWFLPVALAGVSVGYTSAAEWVWLWLVAAIVVGWAVVRPAERAPAPGAAYASAPL